MIVDSFPGKTIIYTFCDDELEKQTFEGDKFVNVRLLQDIKIISYNIISLTNVETILINFT